ncbi:MAG: erythromycin esterase family protein [Phycisphaerales bacterium JB050]
MKLLVRFGIAWCLGLTAAVGAAEGGDSKALSPFASAFESIDSTEFKFLRSAGESARIVGIGESTHGTAEYAGLVREMLEYLATECGYDTLIIEASVGEAAFLNEYVLSQRDDLGHILTEINTSWRYRTTQFVEFLEWLREYNLAHPASQIELHGMEMQIVGADAVRLRAFLEDVGADLPLPAFQKHLWQRIPRSEHLSDYQQVQAILDAFESNRGPWIESHGVDAYAVALHHAEVIQQFLLASAQTREQRKHDLRDLYMGENVEWILSHRGRDSKALVWAHNAHIAKGVDNGIVDVLGHQLHKRFGETYFAIATDFGTGSFYAFPPDANEVGWTMQRYVRSEIVPGTFTETLHELGSPNVFVNLRAAMETSPELSCLLKSPVLIMTGAGAQRDQSETRQYQIGTKFDAVIHLGRTESIEWFDFKASD